MNYELSESLANEFAEVIGSIREDKWEAFSEAAEQDEMAPYLALSRLLVRIVETHLASSENSNGKN